MTNPVTKEDAKAMLLSGGFHAFKESPDGRIKRTFNVPHAINPETLIIALGEALKELGIEVKTEDFEYLSPGRTLTVRLRAEQYTQFKPHMQAYIKCNGDGAYYPPGVEVSTRSRV